MSAGPPRWIVVDDTDSSVTYTGPWFQAASNSLDSLGSYGPTYLGTSHGTNGTASFSYSFQGSAINVMGTTDVDVSLGISNSFWECFINGVSIGPTVQLQTVPSQRPQFAQNNGALCTWDNNGTSGSHVLTVNAESVNHTFWFDWLQYKPPSTASLQHAVVYLDPQDAAIKYDSLWQALEDIANMAIKEGSTAKLDFIGTQLSWYGVIPSEFPHSPSRVTYVIDGQTVPTTFTLQGLPTADSATAYNQEFFQTPTLSSSGPHELVVTFLGNESTTPLTVTGILIQDGSLSVSAPYTSSSSSAPSKPTASSSLSSTTTFPPSQVSRGTIVGGILGGLCLFSLLSLLIVIRYRKRRRPPALLSSLDEKVIEPFHIACSLPQDNGYSQSNNQPGTLTHQSSFQSYEPPSNAATSSGEPPSHLPGHASRLAHYRPQPLEFPSRKQMEATSSTPTTPTTTQLSPSSADTPVRGSPMTDGDETREVRSRVVLHQDSGIRLPRQGEVEVEVVEVPPVYTPG